MVATSQNRVCFQDEINCLGFSLFKKQSVKEDLYSTKHRTKDRTTQTPLNCLVNSSVPERYADPDLLLTTV
jgi:hypothetical protein